MPAVECRFMSDDTQIGRSNSAGSPSVISFYIDKNYHSLNGIIAVKYEDNTSYLKDHEARFELRGSVDESELKVIWQIDHMTMNSEPTDIPSDKNDLSEFD